MSSNTQVDPYTALADVYRAGHFADYSLSIAPSLLNLAFDLNWTGGSLLDIACGTGDMTCWFAGRSMRALGVDISPAMLRHAASAAKTQGLGAEFVTGDMRTFAPTARYDLVTCMGSSINYAPTLRDLERVIRLAYAALEPGKLFIFDLRTIQGLAVAGAGDRIVADQPDEFMILSRNTFNYETLTLTTRYTIYRYDKTANWQRTEETHVLRGYPVQAVTRLLEQVQFKLLRTVTTAFESAENRHDVEQIILVAQR
jgi:SAM-dependent methyltransferase